MSSNYLFFDTETTGLPKSWNAPVSDVDNWPRVVQLAWLSFNQDGHRQAGECLIVKPSGFIIPEEASRVHGVTTERALREGVDLNIALDKFYGALEKADFLVAHNMNYDQGIMGAEFFRMAGGFNPLDKKSKICTMQSATNFCRLPSSRGGYKWPNLTELHNKLFGKGFDGAHDALADVEACARCFFEMKRLGIV